MTRLIADISEPAASTPAANTTDGKVTQRRPLRARCTIRWSPYEELPQVGTVCMA
jgi:hypothetical protein